MKTFLIPCPAPRVGKEATRVLLYAATQADIGISQHGCHPAGLCLERQLATMGPLVPSNSSQNRDLSLETGRASWRPLLVAQWLFSSAGAVRLAIEPAELLRSPTRM